MSDTTEPPSSEETLDSLEEGVKELYWFRDLFFEQVPLPASADRQQLLKTRRDELLERFHHVDESILSGEHRARYLFLQGRTYNVTSDYDPRATLALSKAVKLSPKLVDVWNELGECYWKNYNTNEARSSFEGALKIARTKVTLRSLSIILRQETTNSSNSDPTERKKVIEKSVELAKEAVSLDIKDGVSWCVLGNAYLCYFFVVAQDPAMLKLSMSAHRQAESDAIARGQPDLYYNKGVAHKYCEQYSSALDCFRRATELDPTWEQPAEEQRKLLTYLASVTDLVSTRGKIKAKKLKQMAESIDKKMLGDYAEAVCVKANVLNLTQCNLDDLNEGTNAGKIALGKVVGSIYSENVVPFTFALMDSQQSCVSVTVYNWADGRGVIIGDTVAVPAPRLTSHSHTEQPTTFSFRSLRVDNPLHLMVNGRRVRQNQVAATRITCKYESH